MNAMSLTQIGTVRSPRHDTGRDADWGGVESVIELAPAFAGALEGLADWSHVQVLFHMHADPGEAAPADWRRRPRGRDDMPRVGVFAQRGRLRPNPIGLTAVAIVGIEPGRLRVRGLDAIDGTPVLDLKPYAPAFDRIESPRVPAWFGTLMRGYF